MLSAFKLCFSDYIQMLKLFIYTVINETKVYLSKYLYISNWKQLFMKCIYIYIAMLSVKNINI